MKLYNFLSRKIEDFQPLNPPLVAMYTCGPTVYDYPHIGNLRTFIFEDILQRVLQTNGFTVNRVMNITDIDDKIIKNAAEKGLSITKFSKPFELAFYEDLDKLNLQRPNIFPRATEHIEKMIKYIESLLKKDLAYVVEDGSVYFDISKFTNYGKLSQLDKRELKIGARVAADEYSKENAQDFALWKAVGPDEVGFSSPWGKGRPGWHIECSVMSQEYLGDTLDIHGGAVDLLFPHHENEIAQSEGKTGQQFARFFVEGEHLQVDGQKMSKSLKNFYTLRDIESRNLEPLAFRYLCLTAHYRDRLNFTWESLQAAQNALNNLHNLVRSFEQSGEVEQRYWGKFLEAVNNDLNVPQALAVMYEMLSANLPTAKKAATVLQMDKILGLNLVDYVSRPLQIPQEVQKLLEQREQARKQKDFTKADDLRKEIKKLGFEVEDTTNGPVVRHVN